jgi:lipoprotein Spr
MIRSKIKILVVLFFTIPLLSFSGRCFVNPPDGSNDVFDSTKCNGYQYFKTKGIQFDSTSNLKLYNELYGWLGVPYKWGGRNKAGADCSGFTSTIYKNVYSINVSGSAGDIYKKLKPINKSELKEGDLIFFSFNHSFIAHVGLYLSNNKFIHETSWGRGIMISDLNEPYYRSFYFSAGRYANAADEKAQSSAK